MISCEHQNCWTEKGFSSCFAFQFNLIFRSDMSQLNCACAYQKLSQAMSKLIWKFHMHHHMQSTSWKPGNIISISQAMSKLIWKFHMHHQMQTTSLKPGNIISISPYTFFTFKCKKKRLSTIYSKIWSSWTVPACAYSSFVMQYLSKDT